MIYSAFIREVRQRLRYHAEAGAGRSLDGLKIKSSSKYSADGEKDLPALMLIDLDSAEASGAGRGTLSFLLRTYRKHDLVSEAAEDPLGLIDWLELIGDALETTPDGQVDSYMKLHNRSGVPLNTEVLIKPHELSFRTASISELSFELQIDLRFEAAVGPRAERRSAIVTKDQLDA
jgi:hypothetical protein